MTAIVSPFGQRHHGWSRRERLSRDADQSGERDDSSSARLAWFAPRPDRREEQSTARVCVRLHWATDARHRPVGRIQVVGAPAVGHGDDGDGDDRSRPRPTHSLFRLQHRRHSARSYRSSWSHHHDGRAGERSDCERSRMVPSRRRRLGRIRVWHGGADCDTIQVRFEWLESCRGGSRVDALNPLDPTSLAMQIDSAS